MAHYEISNTLAPPVRTQDNSAFVQALEATGVGEGFTFPVDPKLKAPLTPWKARARAAVDKDTRFRWWLGDPGNGCVKRVK